MTTDEVAGLLEKAGCFEVWTYLGKGHAYIAKDVVAIATYGREGARADKQLYIQATPTHIRVENNSGNLDTVYLDWTPIERALAILHLIADEVCRD